LLWDNKPKTKLGRDRGTAASVHRLPPLPSRVPDNRALPIWRDRL